MAEQRTQVEPPIPERKLIAPLNKIYPNYDMFVAKFKELSFTKKDDPTNTKSKYAIYKLNCYFIYIHSRNITAEQKRL